MTDLERITKVLTDTGVEFEVVRDGGVADAHNSTLATCGTPPWEAIVRIATSMMCFAVGGVYVGVMYVDDESRMRFIPRTAMDSPAKDVTACEGCGRTFSTPVEMLEHRRQCDWTTTRFKNGSYERRDRRSGVWFLKAPNPFGGEWSMTTHERIYGAGGNPSQEGVWRRGAKWVPCLGEDGWTWRRWQGDFINR